MSKKNGMKPQHKKFVRSYVKSGGNGARAARDAGYESGKGNERQQASQLLTKPHIMDAIEKETAEALKAADLTEEDVMQGLMKESGLDGAGGPKDAQHGGRIRAMELCGKALPNGMFTEKTIIEGPQLSGIELIIKLARDGCPNMAVGACEDLGLVTLKTEGALRKVSPEAADKLLPLIPSIEPPKEPVIIDAQHQSAEQPSP